SSVTVGEYLADWLVGQRQQFKATTWAFYRTVVERIDAKIGSLPLQGLRPSHIEFYQPGGQAALRTSPTVAVMRHPHSQVQ
ncbi:MAG: hypothetical protein KC470_11625, partial [Dehalococcoidia bacterium]|nr:hypothetical protein [Dehalococcoidia bacterium]